MTNIRILDGLGTLAAGYDALICDVWGVIHDGAKARPAAIDALVRFKAERGPVVLLTNAPRPASDVEAQFLRYGVPLDCYDGLMTSGIATRAALEQRLRQGPLHMAYLGPERDASLFAGLDVVRAGVKDADLVLCTGLIDDDVEIPEDYRARLMAFAARGIPFLCANPDLTVQRAGKQLYCAGALAALYQTLGGPVVYFGKPHRPIYDAAMALATKLAGRPIARPLAVGDGLLTDIAGANAYGIDALFIADGVHMGELSDLTPQSISGLIGRNAVHTVGAMAALMW